MSIRSKVALLVAAIAALALIAAGCGDDDDEAAAEATSTEESAELVSTDTGAATLRANMTHLLTEHVDLAGIAVVQAAESGLDSAQFEAAAGALDDNSVELSDSIGEVYGDGAAKQFLELWRAHIGMFVDYAEGKLTGNEKQAQGALDDLDGYRQDFGAFLESANPNLTKEAVADALEPHVASLAKTIDAVAGEGGNPFVLLQESASHSPDIALALSGAIAEQNPEQFDGAADSGASTLRSDLTYLLDGHVYAASIAIVTALGNGPDSPEYAAATEALDDNTQALSDAIGGVYGMEAGDQFKDLWNAHIGFFVDYTLAKAEGDEQTAKKAQADLDGYREDFGAFLESANPNLTKEAVADGLQPHVESLLTTIDAAVAGDVKVFSDLRTAASHDVELANTLAGAIAVQFPEKFGG
ncbi:MAG TPA: hypothetical protein VHF58_09205 [Solirubrobacterales bacterium]|nr:hypothetical protein [Solirubrobacterales bacterium]